MKPKTLSTLEAWNQPIHRIRGRIEKIFGTWKRSYGLRRMRWRGLAKQAFKFASRHRLQYETQFEGHRHRYGLIEQKHH
ncbi:transposase [Mesorhizobium sp. M0119]|uniref:transposase n=1 Tax=Mesorhizobium sp. M0119 TaxID=2956885 RepID=UPI00333AA4EA